MKKLERFVIVGDTHGDEIEPEIEVKFFDWLREFNPQIRIHGGDVWNFAALRKKASPDERTTALAPDFKAGASFLGRLFAGGTDRFFLRGNHDERIYCCSKTATDAALAHYATSMCSSIEHLMRKSKAKMLPYDSRGGVLDVKGLRGLHGYASGIGAARKFAFVYGDCFFCHTHSMDSCPVEKYPEPAVARGSGCLCKIDQVYNQTQIGKLRHENGWLYGFTDGARATYFQAKFKDGRVVVAKDFETY